jgi:aconitase B
MAKNTIEMSVKINGKEFNHMIDMGYPENSEELKRKINGIVNACKFVIMLELPHLYTKSVKK